MDDATALEELPVEQLIEMIREKTGAGVNLSFPGKVLARQLGDGLEGDVARGADDGIDLARLLEQALDRGWIVEVDRRIRAAAHSDELVPPDLRGPPVLAECVRDRVAAINSRSALVLVWFSA